jgi:flagellar hook-associated protein 1
MGLTASLLSARSGILGAQAAIDVVSRNIANASTEGYTRKIHNQSNLVTGGIGQGIQIDEVTRQVTSGLQRETREQTAVVEELEIIDDFLGRLELQFGRPDDQSSIAAKMTDLKQAFQALATTPEDVSTQISVITAAQELAREFNDLNDQIQNLRADADARISDQVAEVNTAMANIDSLNTEIGQRKALGQSTADLRDQRDQLLVQVNEKMSITSFERPNGEITVLAPGGNLMLDDTRLPISFVATNTFVAGNTVQPIQISTGSTTVSISADVSAGDGSLAGLLRIRDTLLPTVQTALDDLAFEIATNLATVSVGGVNEAVNLFTDAGGTAAPGAFTNGFAGTIQVRTALTTLPTLIADPEIAAGFTPAGPGDPALPLAIIGVFEATQALSLAPGVNNTMEGFAAQLIGTVANQKADFESQLTFQSNFRDGLSDRFNDESAVNTDQELADLIRLEAAFSASARVLAAVQRAVDELTRVI